MANLCAVLHGMRLLMALQTRSIQFKNTDEARLTSMNCQVANDCPFCPHLQDCVHQ